MRREATLISIMVIVFLVSMFPMTTFSGAVDSHSGSGVFGTQSTVDWWPMFHHDLNHSGYSTSTAPNTNQTVWNYTMSSPVPPTGARDSLAVAEGVVYVGSNHSVYALRASTGAEIWNYTTQNPVHGAPAVASGIIYLGSGNGTVYALDASTGAQIWNYTAYNSTDIGTSSPAVANGMVYVGFDVHGEIPPPDVYALNASTGAEIWNHTTINFAVWSSPAVAEGKVYACETGGLVFALNASTGEQEWLGHIPGSGYSSPAIANGMVYIGAIGFSGSGPGSLNGTYALDASTGALVWNYTTGGLVMSSPAVAYGMVFVGSDDNNIYALNAQTGAKVWNYATGGRVRSSPAVADDKVFVGSDDDRLHCLDAKTGVQIWNYATGSAVSSPAVADNKVFVSSDDGNIYAFGSSPAASVDWWPMFHHDLALTGYSTSTAPNTNQTSWNYTFGPSVPLGEAGNCWPAVADGVVYIGSYALNASTGLRIWNSTTSWMYMTPAVANGIVYTGSNGTLFALDASTGNEIWNYTPPKDSYVGASPAVAYGIVYVGVQNFNNMSLPGFYALNASTGVVVWNHTDFYGGGGVWGSPAIADGRVYFVYFSGDAYCLNASTGEQVWRGMPTFGFGPVYWCSPAVAYGKVYINSYGTYALDASTGALVWNYTAQLNMWSSPAVAYGMVFVDYGNGQSGSDNYTYALNAQTGRLVWGHKMGGFMLSSPSVADGKVFVGSDDGRVYCLDALTGDQIWSYMTSGKVDSAPAVANGELFVGSGDGDVYAFGSVHDVAIASVAAAPAIVCQGYGCEISVIVANKGDFTETFNVTLYANMTDTANATTIYALTNVTLNIGDSKVTFFMWDTAGFATGTYTISAYAEPVPGETNVVDNTFVDGTVQIIQSTGGGGGKMPCMN